MKIFNQVTELTIDNFQNWKTTILYLLSINNLDEYVSTPKVKKKKVKKKVCTWKYQQLHRGQV